MLLLLRGEDEREVAFTTSLNYALELAAWDVRVQMNGAEMKPGGEAVSDLRLRAHKHQVNRFQTNWKLSACKMFKLGLN